jgi:hypothetical protein
MKGPRITPRQRKEEPDHRAEGGADDCASVGAHPLRTQRARGEVDRPGEPGHSGQHQQRAAADVREVVDPRPEYETAQHQQHARQNGDHDADDADEHHERDGDPPERRPIHAGRLAGRRAPPLS